MDVNFLLACRSPGYGLLPQASKPVTDSTGTSSGGEQVSTGQSQQHQFSIPGGLGNMPVAKFPGAFVPFQAPGANVNYGEGLWSNLSASDSQLEAHKKNLQHQIEVW